ncbi:helix-turn-helix transcriptional regulator [Paraglaciecola aquimarina]|uniref:Helix-turn-helix transcriptional regulator n=1 Tax=Paraglaciecola algarum TaxID=3050085 RepID=A0ABS9D300_9ALTE|nr:substrate-binding domain-containing protein [Paraglaciecola sp. G1-23]MCF2947296.1 helix-turn-helix transcriptional regulator [Paraglaciecola sp. G1-23]
MHINKIKIQPSWIFLDEQGNTLPATLFDLLSQIKHNSKLTKAAENVGMSYRGAWNLINKSTEIFGLPLVELHRGRGAKLTPLGEKLLWSKHRVAARLGPQLDNLTSELNIEVQQILADVTPSVRIHASHGYAVALLPDAAKEFQLDLQYKSIEESLAALQRGDCELAGFDVPIQYVSTNMVSIFRRYLDPVEHVIISFVLRQQGLMVQQANPKNIQQVTDLIRSDVKFINRQKDSGTRALLDELLTADKIDPNQIKGFADEEYTHSAVAAFIAAGMADVGLGIEAAASHFGLHFIPVATEQYLFVCKKQSLNLKAVAQLLQLIKSPAFIQDISALSGYTPESSGQIKQLSEVFSWF